MRSNAPVKQYSPVRKSGDHRSIGTHIPGTHNDMSDNGSNMLDSRLSNKYTHLHKHRCGDYWRKW